jgi:catechol 2,3-dioxygenase-like lactoylglutathione lyase family enzyme
MVWWMDHIGLLVSDLARAKNFYGACLAPLGWQLSNDPRN